MDSEFEDYNLDKMLNEEYRDNSYEITTVCEKNEDAMKDFIQINLNLPLYNKRLHYRAEVVGYNYKCALIILGVTERDVNYPFSLWVMLDKEDKIMVDDINKYKGFVYAPMYDIIYACKDSKHDFRVDF